MITIQTAVKTLHKTMSEQDGRCMDDEEDREAFAEHFEHELRLMEIEQTVARAASKDITSLIDLADQLVKDVEAAGVDYVQEDWPDLFKTYEAAKRVVE